MSGKLYVVATPIGNLEDMPPRALRVLREADLIAAEDTRHTGLLLSRFEIRKPLISYHQFSEAKRTAEFLEKFAQGQSIALVSDAGLPGVSDPGERLIHATIDAGVPVEIVPGPSAPLLALAGSGFPMVPFYFGGFLPVKGGQRRKELQAAAARTCTSIYFESPYRIVRMLEDAVAEIPQCRLCLARELTKKFEEYRRGTPAELLAHFQAHEPRGEFCVVVAATD
ncbi:MAG: 16S rRNA (cytidine(1402)-2'-O)-methyltransferase [Methylacidiphilales bacterium]|nr:16S rRNA (cytidine(1402)-2'-O)-methyltransferase [Candidatus Methylacidiphilales bacterium]